MARIFNRTQFSCCNNLAALRVCALPHPQIFGQFGSKRLRLKRGFFHYLPFPPLHPFPPSSISNPFLSFPSGEPFCSARFGASRLRFLLLFPSAVEYVLLAHIGKRKKGGIVLYSILLWERALISEAARQASTQDTKWNKGFFSFSECQMRVLEFYVCPCTVCDIRGRGEIRA